MCMVRKATPQNWAKGLDLTSTICYTEYMRLRRKYEYRNWILFIWIIVRVCHCNGSYVVLGDKVFEKNDTELEIWRVGQQMTNDFLRSIVKEVGNEYASIVDDGVEAGDVLIYWMAYCLEVCMVDCLQIRLQHWPERVPQERRISLWGL